MEFNTHTTINGENIKGKINGGVFTLTHLSSQKRTLPPLNTEFRFDESELERLIHELSQVKKRIENETIKPTTK